MEKKLFFEEHDTLTFSDMACLYGFSLFETFYVDRLGKIFLLDEHIQRLYNSSVAFNFEINVTWQEIESYIISWIKKREITHKVVRISVTFGNRAKSLKPKFFITVREYPYKNDVLRKGFKLKISNVRRNGTSQVVYHKTGNYLENYLELEKAKDSGYDDVLYLNTEGYVAETTKSNIFYIKNQTIFTPSVECGILAGITRAFIINEAISQNLLIKQGEFDVTCILDAEQVFVSNSVFGICPVICIDNKKFNRYHKENQLVKIFNERMRN